MSDASASKAPRREIGSGAIPRALAPPLRAVGAVAIRLAVPIGALCALSAVAMLALCAINAEWMIGSFEVVVIGAGLVAMLAGFGRFKRAPALALLCAGGAIGCLAVLAEPALVSRFLGTAGRPQVIGGFKILPLMMARAVAGAILIATAALVAWGRDPQRSLGYLIRSALAGGAAIIVIVLGVWRAPKGGARAGAFGILDHVAMAVGALPTLVQALLAIIGFFLVVGLVSACGHCLIRSFEVGRLEWDESENAQRAGRQGGIGDMGGAQEDGAARGSANPTGA